MCRIKATPRAPRNVDWLCRGSRKPGVERIKPVLNEELLLHRVPGEIKRSRDQEILEEGGGAGPSTLPRRDHEQVRWS